MGSATAREVNDCENVHRLIEVVLGEPVGEVLGFKETAEFIGTTVNVVRWHVHNKASKRPLPSYVFPITDRKKNIRYFLRAELEEWKMAPNAKTSSWPPDQYALRNSLNGKMLVPKKKEFPDNGTPIPGYQGLSGRWIIPVWRSCYTCGKRFISPDRRNVHSCGTCYQKTADY